MPLKFWRKLNYRERRGKDRREKTSLKNSFVTFAVKLCALCGKTFSGSKINRREHRGKTAEGTEKKPS